MSDTPPDDPFADIRAAFTAATPTTIPLCGAITQAGHPCTYRRRHDYRLNGLVILSGCGWHADPAEIEALEQAEREHAATLYPACWSWPITEDILRRRAHLDTINDDDAPLGATHWDLAVQLLFDWQEGRCAICAAQLWSGLVTDHDHATGLIRGELCRSCNSREGHARHDEPLFARYRQRPPTTILRDLRIAYYSPFEGFAEPAAEPPSQEELRAAVNRLPVPKAKPIR